MSRFNDGDYDEEFNNQSQLFWMNTERAITGRKGIAALRELEAALLALPEPKLASGAICRDGVVCAVGALALKKLTDEGRKREDVIAYLESLTDPESYDGAHVTAQLGVEQLSMTYSLAWRLAYLNDEDVYWDASEEERYQAVLRFARQRIQLAEAGLRPA